MEWYLSVLRNYAVFTGRARRTEFWMFTLVNVVIGVVLSIVDAIIGTTYAYGVGLLYTIYGLAVLIPSLAVAVRRLHDTGRSGWWLLIGLVPVVGGIVLLVFYLIEGQHGDNRYGADPKGAQGAAGPALA